MDTFNISMQSVSGSWCVVVTTATDDRACEREVISSSPTQQVIDLAHGYDTALASDSSSYEAWKVHVWLKCFGDLQPRFFSRAELIAAFQAHSLTS